jgi:hypothetical protein
MSAKLNRFVLSTKSCKHARMSNESKTVWLHIAVGLTLILLAGCSTTTKDLRIDIKTLTKTFEYSENYQEIYRNILKGGKSCIESVNYNASTNFDGQLYSELGYGEIIMSVKGPALINYYLLIEIKKFETGSKMIINSGNTINNENNINRVLVWASGDERCQA